MLASVMHKPYAAMEEAATVIRLLSIAYSPISPSLSFLAPTEPYY